MALKYFVNVYEGNADKAIAINSDHVLSVFPSSYDISEHVDPIVVTNIFCTNGTTFQVKDQFMDVVARLNEKD